MKKLFLATFIAALGLAFTTTAFSQEKVQKKENKEEVKQVEKETAVAVEVKEGKPFNSVCPVSTEELEDPLLVKYNDKVYAVCCKSCMKKFKQDPEKYISRLSDDGKSIKKKKD